MTSPIHLSLADISDDDVAALVRAATSGWVAPTGPELAAFEAEVAQFAGVGHAVALSSGTAALHLALLGLGVRPADEVIVPSLTFAATAFAVVHAGAVPVFVDSEPVAWGMDPAMLDEAIRQRRAAGARVAAIVPVDLFGRPCDHEAIAKVAADHGLAVLVDAAESLGAHYGDRPSGSLGAASVFSFNGNKIMTTSGGGMLVSDDAELVERARYRSTQAREPFPWYEHREIGFNYRMSNLLAALGRSQLQRLPAMIERRRAIGQLYADGLGDLVGVSVTADPPWGHGNGWLTTVRFAQPGAAERVRLALAAQEIEARPIWKPLHRQPVFEGAAMFETGVADAIFAEGLCLPSGVGLTDAQIAQVIAAVQAARP